MISDSVFIAVAISISRASYCPDRQVGCVITKDNRIVSTGYNGTPPGEPNICVDENGKTLPTVIHAEENAIAFAIKNRINLDNCILYVTLSPCLQCAKLIKTVGIKTVIYGSQHKRTAGIEYLKNEGVAIKPADL